MMAFYDVQNLLNYINHFIEQKFPVEKNFLIFSNNYLLSLGFIKTHLVWQLK